MRPPEVEKATDALMQAIQETREYQTYAQLRQSVMADEGTRALLRRFQSAQSALQMAALAGTEASAEDTAAFESLSSLLYASQELTDYLLSQMRVQQLVGGVMERLTREAGIEIQLPER